MLTPPLSSIQEHRVETLLSRLSLAEKVGQLFVVFFTGSHASESLLHRIRTCHLGGVILYSISGNIETPTQVATLVNEIQSFATRHGSEIPLWISIDQEGGSVERLTTGVTRFPSNMAVAATGSVENACQMARIQGLELKALGINLNFAPVMDVNNNPDNPVIGIRAFASDPQQVADFGLAALQGYAEAGVMASAKHFPGHGDTQWDTHQSLPRIDHPRHRLEAVELLPFRQAVAQEVPAIMTAHLVLPALDPESPATLSRPILHNLLRQDLGFAGLIISDSLTMAALDSPQGLAHTAELALLAGVDILLIGADIGHTETEQIPVFNGVLQAYQQERIPLSRLDESVRRILRYKAAYGLLDWVPVDLERIPSQVGIPVHLQTAQDIAAASITLVQEKVPLLPLTPATFLAVIWPAKLHDLGTRLQAEFPETQLLPVGLDPSEEEIAQAVHLAQTAAVIVLATYNGSRFPAQIHLWQSLPPERLVVVATGSPYDLRHCQDTAVCLATYGIQEVSLQALVQVLAGRIRAPGRLPVNL